MLKELKVGFIGGGMMAEAIIKGMIKLELVKTTALFVADVSEQRCVYLRETLGLQTVASNIELAEKVDMVFLTVKPQMVDAVMGEAGFALRADQLLISVAAGITTGVLESKLPERAPVVRVMPNTPLLVGEGATAIAPGRYVQSKHVELVKTIFSAVGRVVVIQEELLDAVTGLSGSGPAYACMIIEALADGGVRMGLPRSTALTLAAQTLLGTAKLLLETGQHPGVLRDMVASPGGTTIAGIQALEDGGLRAALINSVVSAAKRSRELGKGK